MSNQDRLLSDEELREEFADIMADYDRARKSPSGDSVDIEVNTSNRLTKLFNTQKRLFAESVIGEDDNSLTRPYQGNMQRNGLRAEQRERIK